MKYTIKDLAEGKCAVKNDGTLGELREVLRLAFPSDKCIPNGDCDNYKRHDTDHAYWTHLRLMDTDLPTQSVKDFLKIHKIAEKIISDYENCNDKALERVFNPQKYYDNTNGSLYKIATDLNLNHWEFDIFKRLVRCRKKEQFKQDLQKIKDTIDIYIKEYDRDL